jgi:hypothetical protein
VILDRTQMSTFLLLNDYDWGNQLLSSTLSCQFVKQTPHVITLHHSSSSKHTSLQDFDHESSKSTSAWTIQTGQHAHRAAPACTSDFATSSQDLGLNFVGHFDADSFTNVSAGAVTGIRSCCGGQGIEVSSIPMSLLSPRSSSW